MTKKNTVSIFQWMFSIMIEPEQIQLLLYHEKSVTNLFWVFSLSGLLSNKNEVKKVTFSDSEHLNRGVWWFFLISFGCHKITCATKSWDWLLNFRNKSTEWSSGRAKIIIKKVLISKCRHDPIQCIKSYLTMLTQKIISFCTCLISF